MKYLNYWADKLIANYKFSYSIVFLSLKRKSVKVLLIKIHWNKKGRESDLIISTLFILGNHDWVSFHLIINITKIMN